MAGRRIRQQQQKWNLWGKNPTAEQILQDRTTARLFPKMYQELERAERIRGECDITREIIAEQYKRNRQAQKYAASIRQIPITLFGIFCSFLSCLLMLYLCRFYLQLPQITVQTLLRVGVAGCVLFLLFEGFVFRCFSRLEKEE